MSLNTVIDGPFFEDLTPGQVFDRAPGLTLTPGHAALHQAIVGDRLALPLDGPLCQEVTGSASMAHPALVWDTAIGQSTLVTRHVKANLFYRGLAFQRFPLIGDTLRTTTEVVALRQNAPREGRWPTGLAALRMLTVDQDDRPILDFWRCAMLPLRDPQAHTGHHANLEEIGAPLDERALTRLTAGWRLDRFAERAGTPRFAELREGMEWHISGGDVVSSAPELARLTLNLALAHHDASATGSATTGSGAERLVYGGHTIGLALAQACQALPGIVTVVGWHGCDHLGPVHEGDTLRSSIAIEKITPLDADAGLVHLRSRVWADVERQRAVLDWRFVVVMA